jgi:acetyl esterase/lipase
MERLMSERASRRVRWAALVVTLLLAIWVVVSSTPWPSTLLIRAVFEKGAQDTIDEMLPYVPDTPLTEHTDIAYGNDGAGGAGSTGAAGAADAGNTLDVYTPADASGPLPTIVWTHGGAWISGQKQNVEPYLRILASHGYTTIALDYTVAPEAAYPTALNQLNDALGYISSHASELNVDPHTIVLAGDSAGAQLTSQLAVLSTVPDYAELLGITPALQPEQLAGVILNCGVYDMTAMAQLDGIAAWGFKSALWAYTGTKNWSATYEGATMSTIDFTTPDFPPTFISGGNGDGLTWLQSVPMSTRLQEQGVDVTSLFWPADHEPALPHEYQFHLDYPEAQTALTATLEFLDEHTSGRS